MAKDEATADDTNETTNETAGAGAGAGMLAANQPTETNVDEAAAGVTAPFGQYVPTDQDRRQRALELATYGGSGEHKEPIKSVLARAEAYRSYVETGETGIVA